MHNANKAVTVRTPANMNLDQAKQVLAAVLNRVGHPACYSGFNINFVNAVDPSPLVLNVDQGSFKVNEG